MAHSVMNKHVQKNIQVHECCLFIVFCFCFIVLFHVVNKLAWPKYHEGNILFHRLILTDLVFLAFFTF